MAINLGISIPNTQPVSGPLTFSGQSVETLTIAADEGTQGVGLPLGTSTAAFVVVYNVSIADLTIQVSVATGSTVMPIPVGGFVVLYNVSALYVTTTVGGICQVIFGAQQGSPQPPAPPSGLALFPMFITFNYIMAYLSIGQFGWASDEKILLFNTGDATQGTNGIIAR